MIIGIGTDIVKIARLHLAIERQGERFLSRIFTSNEQAYCQKRKNSTLHYAGRFAAKEAVFKAAGTGLSESMTWHDIEIVNDAAGKPVVHLSGYLKQHVGEVIIHLSISHCDEYATAFAVLEQA